MRPRRRRPRRTSPRIRTDAPRTWLVLASSGAQVAELADEIRDLASAGHIVRIGYGRGRLPKGMPRGRHRLGTFRLGPLPLATTLVTLPMGQTRQLAFAARHDRWLAEVASRADDVLFLDELVEGQLRERVTSLRPDVQLWGAVGARRLLTEEAAWRRLVVGARELDARLPDGKISFSLVTVPARTLVDLAQEGPLRTDLSRDVRPELRRIARYALRRGSLERTLDLLSAVEMLGDIHGPAPREEAASAAMRAHIDLVEGRRPEREITELAADVLGWADAALEQDDLHDATDLGAIAMGLLFHQQLHTARADTPLVREPDRFLAPLRESRLGALLATPGAPVARPDFAVEQADGEEPVPSTTEDPVEAGAAAGGDRLRVAILPGVYGHHAQPLIEALDLDERCELTVVRPETRVFNGMMIDTPILRHRLEHALAVPSSSDLGVTPEEFDTVAAADVVVLDWADKGASWASTVVRPDARVVVRVHSVDALSAPTHLVDWSAVDDLVFVADHIRDLFVMVMGDRIEHVRLHVVTNIVPPENFPDPLLPDASRTLGMVGWGQVVKDPSFTLDVLEELLRDDPSWRLRLIGADFGPHHAAAVRAYGEDFRARVMQPHLVDRIDYTGFTRALPGHLRHVGFVVSSSLREGCPIGALEGTAAGAFPVVRDWPAFAPLDAAGRLFPRECVVSTPAQAAALIRSLSDEADRARAVEGVMDQMADNFSSAGTKDRLLKIILSRTESTPHTS